MRSILRSLAAATITQLMFSIVFHKMFYSIFGFKGRGTVRHHCFVVVGSRIVFQIQMLPQNSFFRFILKFQYHVGKLPIRMLLLILPMPVDSYPIVDGMGSGIPGISLGSITTTGVLDPIQFRNFIPFHEKRIRLEKI